MAKKTFKSIKRIFTAANLEAIFEDKFLGRNNAGLDGIDSKRFNDSLKENIEIIRKKVKSGCYKFTPYAETLLTKGRGKIPRVLGLPTMRDQLTLSALKEFLHANFPEAVNRNLANTHIYRLSTIIKELTSCDKSYSFVKTDISGFYDNIDRERLMNFIRRKVEYSKALKIIYDAISNPIVPRNGHKKQRYRYHTSKGIPQGLAISNVLAGIYMQSFDETCKSISKTYLRYVDDILVLCESKHVPEILEKLHFEASKLGLKLNDDKTEFGTLSKDSFDFLGYQLGMRYDPVITENKLRISVRKSSVQKMISSLSAKLVYADYHKDKFLELHETLSADTYKSVLEEDINERITGAFFKSKRYGWLFYFSQIDDMALLHELDRIVEKLCSRCNTFGKTKPEGVKSFVTAFREIHKMRMTGSEISEYIPSYEKFTIEEKCAFLADRGIMTVSLTTEQVEKLFEEVIMGRMSHLESDVKGLS